MDQFVPNFSNLLKDMINNSNTLFNGTEYLQYVIILAIIIIALYNNGLQLIVVIILIIAYYYNENKDFIKNTSDTNKFISTQKLDDFIKSLNNSSNIAVSDELSKELKKFKETYIKAYYSDSKIYIHIEILLNKRRNITNMISSKILHTADYNEILELKYINKKLNDLLYEYILQIYDKYKTYVNLNKYSNMANVFNIHDPMPINEINLFSPYSIDVNLPNNS